MNINKPYENRRTPEEAQASEYIKELFGEDWSTNTFYKQHEDMFYKMYNLDEKQVRSIYREKRKEHYSSMPFLLTLSPIIYCCILLNKQAFKSLVEQVRANDKRNENKESHELYLEHAKNGSRFAKRVILSDPMRWGEKADEMLEAAHMKEPLTYKFRQAEMVGNIM